ncbi:hypothetical protein [Amycolatopsis minnesotensis]|uniref:hypothetical protein n=1 Tax=Amycolatopsis minnesotensis TaxID=337894 RepID=UPI0031D69188
MTPRQLDILRWLNAGCPDRDWPDHTHKHTTRMLQSHGLATISRKHKIWAATITDRGRYYLLHHRYPPTIASRATDPGPPLAVLTMEVGYGATRDRMILV